MSAAGPKGIGMGGMPSPWSQPAKSRLQRTPFCGDTPQRPGVSTPSAAFLMARRALINVEVTPAKSSLASQGATLKDKPSQAREVRVLDRVAS